MKESCRIGDLIIDATLDDAASEGHDRSVVAQAPRLQPWDLCGRTLAKVHLLGSLDVRIASLRKRTKPAVSEEVGLVYLVVGSCINRPR